MIFKKYNQIVEQVECPSLNQEPIKRIHAIAQDKYYDQQDDTLIYKGQFPSNKKTKSKHLTIRSSQYNINNWPQQGFPLVLYIILDDFKDGYYDRQMNKSNKIAALQLTQVTAGKNQGYQNYNLRYNLRQTITWKLPITMNTIKMRLITERCSESIITMPLPSPLLLNFQVGIQ